jgi:hypothetical protein
MLPQVRTTPRERANLTRRLTAMTIAHDAHPHDVDTVEAHYAALERPHACYDGWVFIGHVVESLHDLDGEVVEYERIPCRRCSESR